MRCAFHKLRKSMNSAEHKHDYLQRRPQNNKSDYTVKVIFVLLTDVDRSTCIHSLIAVSRFLRTLLLLRLRSTRVYTVRNE